MFRYVALIWDPRDPREVETAQTATRRLKAAASQWHETLDRAGLRVLCTDVQPGSLESRVLAGRAGVVLGSIILIVVPTLIILNLDRLREFIEVLSKLDGGR